MNTVTPRELFESLVEKDRILEIKGQIRFYLGDVDIVVKQKDVVGNIIQEWVVGWLQKNKYDFRINTNSQMPPDLYLNPENLTVDLLEIKAFNREATPGFDIADFNSFQKEIIAKPYMLHPQKIN
jgi:type-2 restriction enzyme nlaIV